MGINLVQTAAGDFELEGVNGQGFGWLHATVTYDPTSNATNVAMVATRAFRVKGITGRVQAAGTDAGAVTATVYKAPSGTAIASGTALHSGTFNLKGTASTNQTLTLSATAGVLDIASGDTIGVIYTGVLTTATGGITVALTPR
jgi:hypothetical protein